MGSSVLHLLIICHTTGVSLGLMSGMYMYCIEDMNFNVKYGSTFSRPRSVCCASAMLVAIFITPRDRDRSVHDTRGVRDRRHLLLCGRADHFRSPFPNSAQIEARSGEEAKKKEYSYRMATSLDIELRIP